MKAPNRVVAVVAAVMSLLLAVLPVVGNFDWRSTAGAVAGIAAVLGIANRWLIGWQKHEGYQFEKQLYAARTAQPDPPLTAPVYQEFSVPNVTTASTASYVPTAAYVPMPSAVRTEEEAPLLLEDEDAADLASRREMASAKAPPRALRNP